MLFRVCRSSFTFSTEWQRALSTKTLQIPKTYHHTLFSTSFFCKNNRFNQNHSQKISNLNQVKLFHQKQGDDDANKSVVKAITTSFKNNPYVRIARLDKPIGELIKIKSTIDENEFNNFRITSFILAMWLVNSIKCISRLFAGFVHVESVCSWRCIHERCWMYN